MKKLALAAVTLILAATPAFACPDMESKTDEAAPRTAEKDKDKAKDAKGQEKAKAAPPKQAEKPKTAKPNEKAPAKPADKVSSK
jgi:hypothetical protein